MRHMYLPASHADSTDPKIVLKCQLEFKCSGSLKEESRRASSRPGLQIGRTLIRDVVLVGDHGKEA